MLPPAPAAVQTAASNAPNDTTRVEPWNLYDGGSSVGAVNRALACYQHFQNMSDPTRPRRLDPNGYLLSRHCPLSPRCPERAQALEKARPGQL